MGTNYACVPRGSLLGIYLGCTSYMTCRLRRTSTSTQHSSSSRLGWGARQLSAESPCGHSGHSAGVGLGWLDVALPARGGHSSGYRYSCKIAATPPCADAAAGVAGQSQGQKYPVRALPRSLPATSQVALLLHHESLSDIFSSIYLIPTACLRASAFHSRLSTTTTPTSYPCHTDLPSPTSLIALSRRVSVSLPTPTPSIIAARLKLRPSRST
ncbi:hypothetical protein GGI43DRAFT_365921 [Trichoderma evansii]